MSKKQIFIVVVYLLIFGGFGFTVGYSFCEDQQRNINERLKVEYDELRNNYDGLEINYDTLVTELKWQLESCYQQMGDMEDDYDVNNDGVVSMADYAAIKNYVLNQG